MPESIHKHFRHKNVHAAFTWGDSANGSMLIVTLDRDQREVMTIALHEDEVWEFIGWLVAISGYEKKGV